ncbi:MAG TPA: response regulator [Candidatus Limnocylindrales bacterium]|nr:response regulator [Candidatus Limnocylindrales bacterium]
MSTTTLPSAQTKPSSGPNGHPPVERRRRKRAKISAQVHVKVANAPEPFEEICKSVDVSRDGLLFLSARAGYWKGQRLEVTFPYSTAATALNQSQTAEVVRVTDPSGGQYGVAVQFIASKVESDTVKNGADPFASSATTTVPGVQTKQQAVVLAVEKDQRAAEMMRTVLQNDGYTVVVVPTAQQALEVLRTTVPAVFLAEVEAEDMSGHDLCLIIKRNDRLQHVPVILLTRSAQPADYSASHQLGAVVCMAKPFKPERLLHVVRLVAPPPTQKSAYGTRVANSAIERTL